MARSGKPAQWRCRAEPLFRRRRDQLSIADEAGSSVTVPGIDSEDIHLMVLGLRRSGVRGQAILGSHAPEYPDCAGLISLVCLLFSCSTERGRLSFSGAENLASDAAVRCACSASAGRTARDRASRPARRRS